MQILLGSALHVDTKELLTPEIINLEDPRPVPPGNIWSGNPALAHFANPTELAFRKGNFLVHLPVEVDGLKFSDAEQAYQLLKRPEKDSSILMCNILYCKLQQYYYLFKQIKNSGGEEWIKRCSHKVNGKNYWEGEGLYSPFIFCLCVAYSHLCDKRKWMDSKVEGDDVLW